MKLYNTMGRDLAPFTPREPGRVSIYLCGPTVQSEPHLGHGRSAVAFDVLRRYLEWLGYEVDFLRNVTDIDDKIIARANELGVSTATIADETSEKFDRAHELLGVKVPTREPRATEHIDDMIEMISDLIEQEHAYSVDGDVFFSVRSFPGYGKLSGQNVADLRSGERVEIDSRKRDPVDFAMWKAAKPGEPSWPSPWGEGRPGWHIECSAMAREYLGDGFDIHAGGTDLIFPHHENEIAQAEAMTGKPFATVWMHNGMLNLSGEKMAKSTGHVITLAAALEQWDPVAVRLFYLRTHYRKPLDFSESALVDAEASLARLRAFRRRTPEQIEDPPDEETVNRFKSFMDDDLDVAGALGVLFETVRLGNAGLDDSRDISGLVAAFDEMLEVLGLAGPDRSEAHDGSIAVLAASLGVVDGSIDDLLVLRSTARSEGDWARADAIRDGLAELGITIEDTSSGTKWHRS